MNADVADEARDDYRLRQLRFITFCLNFGLSSWAKMRFMVSLKSRLIWKSVNNPFNTFQIVILIALAIISICQSETTSTTKKKRRRSRRPTKAVTRKELIPPVSCNDLFAYSMENGDDSIRRTQHHDTCQKYFECVTNHWVDRDCPGGTTFNNQLKHCDSEKTCKPSTLKERYEEAILQLKQALGLEPRPDI